MNNVKLIIKKLIVLKGVIRHKRPHHALKTSTFVYIHFKITKAHTLLERIRPVRQKRWKQFLI